MLYTKKYNNFNVVFYKKNRTRIFTDKADKNE